jgi:lysophospholipase L1-like esterase
LNRKLSDGDYLRDDYAAEDGLHFSAETYAVWKNEVIEILNRETSLLATTEDTNGNS